MESLGQWEPGLMGYMDATNKATEINQSEQKNKMNMKKDKRKK